MIAEKPESLSFTSEDKEGAQQDPKVPPEPEVSLLPSCLSVTSRQSSFCFDASSHPPGALPPNRDHLCPSAPDLPSALLLLSRPRGRSRHLQLRKCLTVRRSPAQKRGEELRGAGGSRSHLPPRKTPGQWSGRPATAPSKVSPRLLLSPHHGGGFLNEGRTACVHSGALQRHRKVLREAEQRPPSGEGGGAGEQTR